MGRSINIFTDGASRGNPGNAGAGVVILENKKIIIEYSEFLGKKTNNEAEYLAVIRALEKLHEILNEEIKNIKLNLYSDSEFLIKQLNGEYKVKADKIKPLFNKVQKLKENLKLNVSWIPRGENEKADLLANKGIDEKKENSIKQKFSINNELILEKAFFGKINCFKIQMNQNKEVYFHIGISNKNNWDWTKVKMNDGELGELIWLLEKDEGKCSFYHSFNNSKTQIWCNKNKDRFSIKIDKLSKNFTIGEFSVLKIILKECIIKMNFIQ